MRLEKSASREEREYSKERVEKREYRKERVEKRE